MANLSCIILFLFVTCCYHVIGSYRKSSFVFNYFDTLLDESEESCKYHGVHCADDCTSVLRCVDQKLIPLEECDDQSVCDREKATCSTDKSVCSVNGNVKFSCQMDGIFPDPVNCSIYHICAGGNEVVQDCPEGYAFDIESLNCDLKNTSTVCTDGPVPACTKPGDIGSFPANPSYYYVCIKNETLYPILFQCGHGQFNDSIQDCM